MKKNVEHLCSFLYGHRKKLLIMRNAFILMLISVLQGFATGSYSQTSQFSFKMENASIKEVISKIESQSEYYFLYNSELIDVTRKVDISVKNEKVEDILPRLFNSNEVNFVIRDRYIVLTPVVEKVVQQKSVSGKITDAGGQPLPGVTVIIKGTTNGTVTNADGQYSLANVSDNATLQFSFVGMKTQEIPVAGKSVINVTMAEEAIGIDEVVAIGYGTQKKVNLTGSIAIVSSEEIAKSPVQNPLQSLQGKTPGLSIVQNTGQPGNEGYQIRIRGLNSYGSSNEPLIIVDGVVGSLSMLNPKDIESISVLKDASSAAIYGARAANGVILVTTKSGKVEPMSLQYSSNFSIHNAIMPFDFMDLDAVSYMELSNQASENATEIGYAGASFMYDKAEIEKYRIGTEPGYQSFDWLDYMMQSPLVMNHYLNVTGGNEKARYDVGLGYFDQNGIIKNAFNYKKYTGKAKFDFKINDYIEFGTNILLEQGVSKEVNAGSFDVFWKTIIARPTTTPKLPDGSGRWTHKDYANQYANGNPALAIDEKDGGSYNSVSYNVLASAYLRTHFLKYFSWDITGSTTNGSFESKKHTLSIPTYIYHTGVYSRSYNATVNSINDDWNRTILNTLYSTLKYGRSVNNAHNFNLLLGYNQESYIYKDLSGYRENFSSNNLDALSAGGTTGQSTEGGISDWSLQSLFGRVNYDYKGKYLFEASFRYDGSSRFHPDYRWGLFPSLSVGWRLSEESFMKEFGWIDNIKFRGSWGQLGNQEVGTYPYQNTVSLGSNYAFSSSETQGAYISKFTNNKISWETTTITNIGIDLSIYKGLFSMSLDVFEKETKDIIRELQVPSALGLDGPTINGGKMKNSGYELVLGHDKNINDFRYHVGFTLSHFKNTLIDFGAREISGSYIYEEGLPYQSYYLHEFEGIFQSQEDIDNSATQPYQVYPGAIKLKDQNDDGVIDGDDRVVMNGAYPKFDSGMDVSFQYKNFDFSAFIYGVFGKKFLGSIIGTLPFYQGIRPTTVWKDAWTENNPSNELPLLINNHVNVPAMRYTSSFFLLNTSYLRLKNIQLGYNVPNNRLINKIGIKSLRVYFSGENLLTWDNMKFGGDPEMTSQNGHNVTYPQVRIFSLGLDVKL